MWKSQGAHPPSTLIKHSPIALSVFARSTAPVCCIHSSIHGATYKTKSTDNSRYSLQARTTLTYIRGHTSATNITNCAWSIERDSWSHHQFYGASNVRLCWMMRHHNLEFALEQCWADLKRAVRCRSDFRSILAVRGVP